jgi:hypothetical protein
MLVVAPNFWWVGLGTPKKCKPTSNCNKIFFEHKLFTERRSINMSLADKVVAELVNQIREWEDETGLSELIHRLVQIGDEDGQVIPDILEALESCLDDEDNHEEGA